jgi:hypothetical protein
MNENVIKMARLMVGCKDRTCEDCLSQSKKLFGDNKCALIEYAEVLDKAGYRKQSETVKEFAEKLKTELFVNCVILQTISNPQKEDMDSSEAFQIIDELAEQYGKED